jgi:hypothetical protein
MRVDELHDPVAIFHSIERRDVHVRGNCKRSSVGDNP